MNRHWTVPCQVLRVIDGDTVVVRADLGFRVGADITVRLRGINCPEMVLATGKEAKRLTEAWLANRPGLELECHGPDKFGGRWDGRLFAGPQDLAEALLAAGHAKTSKR
jgi:endonuclease YncB( thermonuclease family)